MFLEDPGQHSKFLCNTLVWIVVHHGGNGCRYVNEPKVVDFPICDFIFWSIFIQFLQKNPIGKQCCKIYKVLNGKWTWKESETNNAITNVKSVSLPAVRRIHFMNLLSLTTMHPFSSSSNLSGRPNIFKYLRPLTYGCSGFWNIFYHDMINWKCNCHHFNLCSSIA